MNDKLKQVKKYFKNTNLIFEIELSNYEAHNLYIRLDYFKKDKCYRVSWLDLDTIRDKNTDKLISYQYVQDNIVNMVINDITSRLVESKDLSNPNIQDSLVITNIYLNKKEYIYKFNRYIPKELDFLGIIYANIFDNLPRKIEAFLFELTSILVDNNKKYDYKKPFKFDLFKSNLEDIFDADTINQGKKYLDKVLYLEKYDQERYFAVVQGKEKYLIVIKYDEEHQMLQLYCSCPCEFQCKHLYAVIENLRAKKFHKFYKVYQDDGNKDLLARLTSLNFTLCLGIVNNQLEIINNNGGIELVPIIGTKWVVLEDDEDKTLSKQIEKIIKG